MCDLHRKKEKRSQVGGPAWLKGRQGGENWGERGSFSLGWGRLKWGVLKSTATQNGDSCATMRRGQFWA